MTSWGFLRVLTALHPSRQCVRVHGAPCKAEWMHSRGQAARFQQLLREKAEHWHFQGRTSGVFNNIQRNGKNTFTCEWFKKKTKAEGNLWGRMSRWIVFFFNHYNRVYLIKIIHMAEIKRYFILHIPCVHIFKEDEKYIILRIRVEVMIKLNGSKLIISVCTRYLNSFNFFVSPILHLILFKNFINW